YRDDAKEGEAKVHVIYKVSPKGEILTKLFTEVDEFIDKPYNTFLDKDQLCGVDKAGNIYQLWLGEKKVKIIKWSNLDGK
ncbi:MAG: hypothetical protein LLG37_00300, partial [Spirochaetia bacterium]|nr:hypothetical protein [Spirochaetia bacterium]